MRIGEQHTDTWFAMICIPSYHHIPSSRLISPFSISEFNHHEFCWFNPNVFSMGSRCEIPVSGTKRSSSGRHPGFWRFHLQLSHLWTRHRSRTSGNGKGWEDGKAFLNRGWWRLTEGQYWKFDDHCERIWHFPYQATGFPSHQWEFVWAVYANQDSSRRLRKHWIIIYTWAIPDIYVNYWRATNVAGTLKSFGRNQEGFEVEGAIHPFWIA